MLLAFAFRSIVLPLKAVVLNLISLAAAFGVIVIVFQQGHGSPCGTCRPAARSPPGCR